ncbi:MAG: FxsA family protein [Solirubrobacteraceae bacterium]
MPLLLFLIFIVVPIAELYVLIQVGQAIGALPTIGLLIADSILGAALMRSQGRAAWRRFNVALAEGRVPHREVLDGVLVIFGGALLLTPGFLTDILGLFLLLPPTRALVRTVLVRRFAGRVASGAAQGANARFGRMFTFQTRPPGPDGGRPREPYGDDVVDGEATEVEPRRPERP